MAKANVDIRAFNRSLGSLDKAFIERIDKIEKAFRQSMDKMANDAKRDAPIGVLGPHPGRLADSINWDNPKKLSYELRAEAPYAAYVEFGTGPYAKQELANRVFPNYWRDIARKFKKSQPGRTEAQPFFYPNVRKEIPKLRERIAKILSKNA